MTAMATTSTKAQAGPAATTRTAQDGDGIDGIGEFDGMLGLFWDEENCMHGYSLFAILKNASAFF